MGDVRNNKFDGVILKQLQILGGFGDAIWFWGKNNTISA